MTELAVPDEDEPQAPTFAGRYPSVAAEAIGWLNRQQMVEVDRIMIDELGIDLVRMMENAGRNLAQLVIDRFGPDTVTVLAGSGGNGGGGLVAARHLANRGVAVHVTLGVDEHRLTDVPRRQLEILRRMGVEVTVAPRPAPVTVDALIGYSLYGAPRGRIAELIDVLPSLGTTIVSLDTPSGVDVSDGSCPGAVVNATATLTLAMPKLGLRHAAQVGELYCGDISVPAFVYGQIGAGPAPDFSQSQILQVVV